MDPSPVSALAYAIQGDAMGREASMFHSSMGGASSCLLFGVLWLNLRSAENCRGGDHPHLKRPGLPSQKFIQCLHASGISLLAPNRQSLLLIRGYSFIYFFLIGGGRYHCLNTEPNCLCIVFQGDTIQLDLKLYKRAHREKGSQARANKQAVLLNSPSYCLRRTQIYFQSLKQIESNMPEGTVRWYSISALLLQKDHT